MKHSVWHPLPAWAGTWLEEGPVFGSSVPDEYVEMATDLMNLYAAKLGRNRLRMRYYQGKNRLKDLGISIPPSLTDVETVVGWPAISVDTMSARSRFEGFTALDDGVQAELDRLSRRSNIKMKYRQLVQSALIYSCCFSTITLASDGARIDLFDAEQGAARWDIAKAQIAYGMVVDAYDEGLPSEVTMFTDDAAVHLYDVGGWWDCDIEEYTMGRPCMASIAYKPTFRRPFGQSRINRAVMSICDSAVRESLRAEISAEFASFPQRYLLGADEEAFANTTKWEAVMNSIFAVGRDEDGNVPQFGQLAQVQMQPHTEYMRSLAARFSAETHVPISQLGVIHDQPASAEAIYAAAEPLIIDTADFNEGASAALVEMANMALAAELDVPLADLPPEYVDVTATFKNPALPSIVSQTDAVMKLASVVPGFAGTEIFWEQVGMNDDDKRRAMQQTARNQASSVLNNLLANPQQQAPTEQ